MIDTDIAEDLLKDKVEDFLKDKSFSDTVKIHYSKWIDILRVDLNIIEIQENWIFA